MHTLTDFLIIEKIKRTQLFISRGMVKFGIPTNETLCRHKKINDFSLCMSMEKPQSEKKPEAKQCI